MTRRQLMVTSVRWGVGIALLHFFADLLGASLAIGWLFDASVDGFVLLSVVPVTVALAGALVGAVVGMLYPRRWTFSLSKRVTSVLGVLLAIGITFGGYTTRKGRQLSPVVAERHSEGRGKAPVLWVMMDTLRADTLYGPDYGFSLAPELGEFAKDALVFKKAESTAGWTIPATATLMTGIHNMTMDASAGRLPEWAPTVAEHLYGAGYRTHAVVDNVIVEPRAGFGAGFESFFQKSSFRFVFSLPGYRLLPEWFQMECRRRLRSFYYGAPGVTDEAVKRIESVGDEPLFLYVHYMDPHAPYNVHPEVSPLPQDSEEVNYYDWRILLHKDDTTERPTLGQQRTLIHRYEGEVSFMSREIKRLLDVWYERYGDSGLVMFTSDHGEEFLEHGHYGHGHTVHKESVNVPLMFQFPKGVVARERASGLVEHPVSLLDVLPTTLDAIGVEPVLRGDDFPIQGQSMLPWLRGEEPFLSRPLIASHSRHKRRVFRYRQGDGVFLKTGFYNGDKEWRGFFDLKTDEAELENLIRPDEPEPGRVKVASRHFEKIAGTLWKAKDKLSEAEKNAGEESLRAIGYIE